MTSVIARFSLPLAVVAVVVIALMAGVPTVAAAGPWRGQIFASDTQRPLPGVLVLGVTYRLEGGWWGHSAWYYHDSSEAITRADGRFEIPSRSFWSLMGKELRFTHFKFGYGQWRYLGQGTPAWRALPAPERSKHSTAMREALTSPAGAYTHDEAMEREHAETEWCPSFGSVRLR